MFSEYFQLRRFGILTQFVFNKFPLNFEEEEEEKKNFLLLSFYFPYCSCLKFQREKCLPRQSNVSLIVRVYKSGYRKETCLPTQ